MASANREPQDDKPVGIVTEADCENVDRFTQLNKIMSKDLVTLNDDVTPKAKRASTTATCSLIDCKPHRVAILL